MAYVVVPKWRELQRSGLVSADDVLAAVGVRTPPVPVAEIAKRLGATVKYSHTGVAGGLHVNERDEATIWVNALDARSRQRFTIAHEIGHLMNDVPDPTVGVVELRDTDYERVNPVETRANQFAADLLMPAWMVRVWVKTNNVGANMPLPEIARAFQLSEQATAIRLRSIYNWRWD